ncbi:MAG TPA: hypothetical protein VN369_04470, partial [Terriglobales bacterium]|nr:hypothetical protein [Terriglobales bacterium]
LEDLSGIDVPRVVREVARIAFAGDGEDDGGPEVKPADRLRALDMLAKHLSLYEPGEKAKEAAGGVVILPEVLPEEEGP